MNWPNNLSNEEKENQSIRAQLRDLSMCVEDLQKKVKALEYDVKTALELLNVLSDEYLKNNPLLS